MYQMNLDRLAEHILDSMLIIVVSAILSTRLPPDLTAIVEAWWSKTTQLDQIGDPDAGGGVCENVR